MPDLKPALEPNGKTFKTCGHNNYGSVGDPATVFADCPVCGPVYCSQCNYDTHRCGGCGDELTHISAAEHFLIDCTEG